MSFHYVFQVFSNSPVLKSALVAAALPRCSEISFISAEFDSYDTCYAEVILLFSKIGKMAYENSDDHAIVHKFNPNIFDDPGANIGGVNWSTDSVDKFFLADTKALKAGSLNFSALAEIKFSDLTINQLKELVEPPTEEVET